jgi:hypothetical protein
MEHHDTSPPGYRHEISWYDHFIYALFYFHHDQVLLIHTYATSTTATTVGDGGNPQGSTELDNDSGYNFKLPDD